MVVVVVVWRRGCAGESEDCGACAAAALLRRNRGKRRRSAVPTHRRTATLRARLYGYQCMFVFLCVFALPLLCLCFAFADVLCGTCDQMPKMAGDVAAKELRDRGFKVLCALLTPSLFGFAAFGFNTHTLGCVVFCCVM